jgi:hypothetical protein
MGKIADKRVKRYMENLRKLIDNHLDHPMWGAGSLEDRVLQAYEEKHLEWMESFCVGNGFNMGCGEIPIADSVGVDVMPCLGIFNNEVMFDMENPSFKKDEICDYIVSNYIDGLKIPAETFIRWHRLLKPGGKIALLCRDADTLPDNSTGGMKKSHRGNLKLCTCYTKKTLRFYLQFAGYVVDSMETDGGYIKAVAHKP